MGLFDFFKKKQKGIEINEFNSSSFQTSCCALAIWKLEENNLNPQIAIQELLKIGLSNEQASFIIEKSKKIIEQKDAQPKGIDAATFNNKEYQKEILELTQKLYFENNHNYEAAKKELHNRGLNSHQINEIIESHEELKTKMVNDFQEKLDSGAISEIKIHANPEHKKGKVDKDQVDKYIGYGAYQMERGDLDNALELLDKAIELDENATLAYANKGTLYSRKGDNIQALLNYNKALSIEPDHLVILENKMDLLLEMINDIDSENNFIDTVKKVLKQDPNHPDALIYIIQFYAKENRMEDILSALKNLFSNHYTENIVTQLMLDIFSRLSEDEALEQFKIFEKEINEASKYQLLYNKGLYLKGIGKYDDAIQLYDDLNKLQDFSWNYYQTAIMKNLQGKTDESIELLKTTFKLEPGLKEDAKKYPELQNLWTNPKFIEITK